MKKLFLLCSLTMIAAAALSAAVPACSTFGNPIPYATWTSAGFACIAGDKTVSNFTSTNAPTNTDLNVFVQGSNYIVTFGGSFTAAFSVSYIITVAPSAPAGTFISAVGLDENAPAMGATAQVTK